MVDFLYINLQFPLPVFECENLHVDDWLPTRLFWASWGPERIQTYLGRLLGAKMQTVAGLNSQARPPA